MNMAGRIFTVFSELYLERRSKPIINLLDNLTEGGW